MLLSNDLVADGHSHASSLSRRFCGEERIENALERVRRNAAARVRDLDAHRVFVFLAGPEGDRSALWNRLEGIAREVDENLLDLFEIHIKDREILGERRLAASERSAAPKLAKSTVRYYVFIFPQSASI